MQTGRKPYGAWSSCTCLPSVFTSASGSVCVDTDTSSMTSTVLYTVCVLQEHTCSVSFPWYGIRMLSYVCHYMCVFIRMAFVLLCGPCQSSILWWSRRLISFVFLFFGVQKKLKSVRQIQDSEADSLYFIFDGMAVASIVEPSLSR